MPRYGKTTIGCLTGLVAMVIPGACSTSPAHQQHGPTPSINHQILFDLMSEYDIPGMAVAVSYRGQDQFGDYGVIDLTSGEAVTRDTLFEIGSVSKLFTVMLATVAEQEGLFSLDAPIGGYMPDLDRTYLGRIAALHLTTHTAGGFPLQLPDHVATEAELVQYYRDWVPQHPEGTYRHYANPSIGLLGLLVARVKGVGFVELMEKDLFPSIGMSSSFIRVPEEERSNYAWGHNRRGEQVRVSPALLADESYGIKTTSTDLLKFLKLNLGCDGGLSALESAVCRMHMSCFDAGPFEQAMIWEKYEYPVDIDELRAGNSYRMIMEAAPVDEIRPAEAHEPFVLSKTGSTSGFGAYVLVVPDEELAIVLLANKNLPIQARVEAAHQLMADVLGATAGHNLAMP